MKPNRSLVIVACIGASVAMAQSDTEPPQLLAMSFSPTTVDVTDAPRTIVFTLHVTDDLSGIDFDSPFRLQVSVRSPSGTQTSNAVRFRPGVITNADDIEVAVEIPRYAEPGTWSVSSVRLRDNVGNTAILNTSALAAAGFPTAFAVIDATPDLEPPQLIAISIAPTAVDVSTSDATITVNLTLTDDASGVTNGANSLTDFEMRSPSGAQSRFIQTSTRQLISGTTLNGIWRGTFTMPRYSEPGVWKVVSVRVRDGVRRAATYSETQLAAFGAAIEVNVTSSPFDITAPELTNLSFGSAFINTSTGSQAVQVNLTLSDNLAGVSFVPDVPSINVSSFRGITFRSPSGAQSVSTDSLALSGVPPISGSPLSGIWSFNAVFPQFSEEGTWTASAMIKDTTRNLRAYSTAQLAALGMPSQIVIIRPSLQADGTVGSAGGIVSDNTFGSRAQLIVPAGVFAEVTTVAIDVLESPLGVPLPAGFSSAETYFVNIELTPRPSYPLPPPGITVVLPLRNYTIPGTQINLFRIDPATGNLVPALDVLGNPVVGHVQPGGLTAMFNGVAGFSTVVGILPTAITVAVDIKPGETPNVINTKSKGTIPIAIFSTPTLDLTQIDPSTLHFSGAPVAINTTGKWRVAHSDLNDDGLADVVAHFVTEQILLGPGDTHGLVEGRTLDNRIFRGLDVVRVINSGTRE